MEKTKDLLTFHAPDLTTRQELPVAGGDVKAGFPSPADDFLDSPLDLNRELVHNPASTFFVRVSGDSMAGALLARMLERGWYPTKYEVMEPSLHEIFIEKVGEDA